MSLVVGDQVGPYEILASLGAGGMGEVYRARDPRLDRVVAIKIVTASRRTSPAQIDRLLREARAIARISHPHICVLHDVGQLDDVPFLVMELLEGPTLAERIERGPLPVGEALRIGSQIARALDGAHRSGVIHRDLKPSNVMLTPSGVKLLDFGLAKLRDTDRDGITSESTKSLWHTDDGAVLGTLPYMAPEQVEGLEADARTDIFAVGVVLFEMLTGEAPFTGASQASLTAAILTHAPPPITTLVSTAPASLDRVVAQCLAKDPEQRWQSARDLASALDWSAEHDAVGRGAAATPVANTRRLTAAVALVAGVSAVAAAAIWSLGGPAALLSTRTPVPSFHQVTYRRGAVSSAQFTPDGQSFVYSASWDGQPWSVFLGRAQSPDARNLGVDGARIVSISAAGDMALIVAPQNIVQAFGARTLARVPMAGGARRDLLGDVVDADWIPGTDSLAVVRDPGGGRKWTVEFPAGTPVHEAPAAWSLRVSPDGSRVAFFEGPILFDSAPLAAVTVIDRAGTRSTVARNWAGTGLAWTPRGDEIWFTAARPGDNGPQLRAVSLSGAERTVHRAPDWLVLHDIAQDGRVLLSRNSIRISMVCKSKTQPREADLSWLTASFVTGLSANGDSVAFVDGLTGRTPAGNATIFLRKLDGATPPVAIGEGSEAKISPDGRWILTTRPEGYALLPTGAGPTLRLPKGEVGRVLGAAWLGDSKRIAFAGIPPGESQARGYIQDVPDGTPRAITPPAVRLPGSPATVRGDESVLGFVEPDDRWALYPIDGGKPEPVPGLTGRDIPIQWSSDGRWLYAVSRAVRPLPSSLEVYRVELATGRRVLWKTLSPYDSVGVEVNPGRFTMTADAETYCYSFIRRLGDLFVAEGLK